MRHEPRGGKVGERASSLLLAYAVYLAHLEFAAYRDLVGYLFIPPLEIEQKGNALSKSLDVRPRTHRAALRSGLLVAAVDFQLGGKNRIRRREFDFFFRDRGHCGRAL